MAGLVIAHCHRPKDVITVVIFCRSDGGWSPINVIFHLTVRGDSQNGLALSVERPWGRRHRRRVLSLLNNGSSASVALVSANCLLSPPYQCCFIASWDGASSALLCLLIVGGHNCISSLNGALERFGQQYDYAHDPLFR